MFTGIYFSSAEWINASYKFGCTFEFYKHIYRYAKDMPKTNKIGDFIKSSLFCCIKKYFYPEKIFFFNNIL